MRTVIGVVLACLFLGPGSSSGAAAELILRSCKFFDYLTGRQPATMIAYTPAELDPRNPANQRALKTSSIRADLEPLRPAFDGLILYGYHEACTPRILGGGEGPQVPGGAPGDLGGSSVAGRSGRRRGSGEHVCRRHGGRRPDRQRGRSRSIAMRRKTS